MPGLPGDADARARPDMTRLIESVDSRMVALIRVVLALAAFLFTYIDPPASPNLTPALYGALTLYTVYSATLYLMTVRRAGAVADAIAPWIDIACYVLFIALSGGSNSIYYPFFFFGILVTSFRSGFEAGLRAAVFSAALFAVVGYSMVEADDFQLSRFLIRPACLLALGYLIAYWGGQELQLRRQRELLKDVTVVLNPRFGAHHLISHVVNMLREFYDARVCLLILDEGGDSCLLFRAGAGSAGGAAAPVERVSAASIRALMRPDGGRVITRTGERRWPWGRAQGGEAFDSLTQEPVAASREEIDATAEALGARSFLSVPVNSQMEMSGRFYLLDPAKPLDKTDADFILQVFEHTKPFIENVRLVDTLASGAAEEERQKIARDIHDGVIQPYIGLQLGLEALRRQAEGHSEVSRAVERLIALTEGGIEDLRDYIGGLKTGGARKGSLLPALRRFGAKFSEATGIAVTVESDSPDLFLNDRLAGEVFQMVTEALSNIRRHTESKTAFVRVGCDGRAVRLHVSNAGAAGEQTASFMPRSIKERAASLGGTVTVNRPSEGGVVVEVKIPL